MSGGMEDLARMLGRLREETPEIEREVRPSAQPVQGGAVDPMPYGVPRIPAPGITSRDRRPPPGSATEPPAVHHGSLIWAENKETLIFGLLISVLASSLGVIGGYPYLVLFGSVAFMLFAIASFLVLMAYYFRQRRRWGTPESSVNEQVERLRRRVETLELRSSSPSPSREKELERRIEELRIIVISLSRAVENPGRR